MAAYWAKSGGEAHFNNFLFISGVWGDDRLELDNWLQSMFTPLLYPKDLAKMVTCCPFYFSLLRIFLLSQVVKKKSDMRTNMTSRLLVAQCKVYGICDKDGKVQHPT